jgi:hypothetical protein
MDTATVTIGRNVGTEPMSDDRWTDYVRQARQVAQMAMSDVWADAGYDGGWEGNEEDAWAFYGPLTPGLDVDALRSTLATLADVYGQDAIGLSVGVGELVGPRVPTVTVA